MSYHNTPLVSFGIGISSLGQYPRIYPAFSHLANVVRFFIWGKYNNAAINVENWGWLIEWTPAFIGAGMLVGLNTAISFYAGSIIAWGIIGPTLVHYNVAFGNPIFAEGDTGYDKWANYINYASLNTAASTKDTPSPRFWLLWPGVLLMIVVSFVELGMQYKIFVYAGKAVYRGSCAGIAAGLKKMGKPSPAWEKRGHHERTELVKDFAEDHELVKWWMWFPLLVVIIICTCVVMGVQFGMPVGMSLLSIFLAFFFSILAVQCTGVTDITPLTAASKASQIVLGGATKGENWQIDHAQRLNLLGGSLASIGANQVCIIRGLLGVCERTSECFAFRLRDFLDCSKMLRDDNHKSLTCCRPPIWLVTSVWASFSKPLPNSNGSPKASEPSSQSSSPQLSSCSSRKPTPVSSTPKPKHAPSAPHQSPPGVPSPSP